jgi:hypothetical protein
MKQTLTLLSLLVLLGSCVTKNIHKIITKHYPYHEEFERNDSNEAVIVLPSEKLAGKQQLTYSKHIKKQFIPAIIFWKWDQMYKCELDYKQELEKVCSDVKAACYRNNLDSIVPKQKLELTIKSAPFTFIYEYKGFVFFYVMGYLIAQKQSVFPAVKENFIVHYKLYSDMKLIKEGDISIEDKRTEAVGPYYSLKKMVDDYMSQTREQLMNMKEEFITKFENEMLE